ncbi:hypothetical protein GCM10028895_47580 [Pontibacter rugosus]
MVALGFRYGQKHEVELRQAQIIAEKAQVPFRVIDISGMLQGSALTEHDKDVSAQHDLNESLPAAFVPGRNAVFLTIAISYAFTQNITHIIGGMCR